MANSDDLHFLRRALELAREGVGLTSPNPYVGAVVVNNGAIVGAGFHTYDGIRHAEVIALKEAGGKVAGATLYINLEPCSHQGRTGPCAEAIIQAKLSRVVACMQDPNPVVSGKGFEMLRSAGIAVDVGELEAEARFLNENFAKYVRHRTPLVTLKAAMTLDGKIAPPVLNRLKGGPEWITGEDARAHVQQLRHQNDAIMVGVGTVIADDPLLTDRTGKPRRRTLQRVILDSRLRLPLESRIVQTAQEDVIVICALADKAKKKRLLELGIRVEQIASINGRPAMQDVINLLGNMEITGLIIEGGAQVNWAALASGVVDKVFLYYAPKILAGSSIPFAAGDGFSTLEDAPGLKSLSLHRFENDFAVEGYLRDPYLD